MVNINRTLYKNKELARSVIQARRLLIRQVPTLPARSTRFDSDDAVVARLESMFTEQEFLNRPFETVDAALKEAARSDYWYAVEKDWGLEYEGEYEDSEEDNDNE